MNASKIGTWAALYGAAMVIALGVLLWTTGSKRNELNHQILTLEEKMRGLSGHTSELERLAVEVSGLRKFVDNDLKAIPASADVASLIGRLSLPVDGTIVVDQTFTRGSVGPAIAGDDGPLRVMPVTIDMEATFDSLFAVLRSAESMQRLIRIATLRMNFERDEKTEHIDVPRVRASMSLEAVFEAPPEDPSS
jgi:Tfp pilus assembly protein PilO